MIQKNTEFSKHTILEKFLLHTWEFFFGWALKGRSGSKARVHFCFGCQKKYTFIVFSEKKIFFLFKNSSNENDTNSVMHFFVEVNIF